jgi:hypothetical protein
MQRPGYGASPLIDLRHNAPTFGLSVGGPRGARPREARPKIDRSAMNNSTKATIFAATAAGMLAAGSLTSAASAQPQHNSYTTNVYCLSVPYVPGDCTGFIVGRNVTVQMQCWNTGPSALGSGKWFEITVLSGNGYGATGELPANDVGNQWTTSPRC